MIGKALIMAGAAASMMEGVNKQLFDQTPKPRIDTSKPAALTNNERKKRKRKLKISKRSRKQNRK